MNKKRDFSSMMEVSSTANPRSEPALSLSRKTQERVAQFSAEKLGNGPMMIVRPTLNLAPQSRFLDSEFVLFLEVLAALRNQPASWPKILSIDTDKEKSRVVFDLSEIYVRFAPRIAPFDQKVVYHIGYGRFITDERRVPIENNVQIVNGASVLRLQMRPRNRTTTHAFAAQCAAISQEYIERIEVIVDAGNAHLIGGLNDTYLRRCLLIEPYALYQNECGRIYHIPMIQGIVQKQGFVPEFINRIIDNESRLRVAQLFCLVRMIYSLAFYRSFDEDFATEISESSCFGDWVKRLHTSRFPEKDCFGMPASVYLINWMFACLTNRIKTNEISLHRVFTDLSLSDWHSCVYFGSNKFDMAYREFHAIMRPISRQNDARIVFKIDYHPHVSEDSVLAFGVSNRLTAQQRDELAFSMSLCALLHIQHPSYEQGFSLNFEYNGTEASGVGVSKEIVMRAFEGLKYWNVYVFREQENMLDFALDLCQIQKAPYMFEFLFVLVYWCAVRVQRMPYLLSPAILSFLFGLPTQYDRGYALDHKRQIAPDLMNNILSLDETDTKKLRAIKNIDDDDESVIGEAEPTPLNIAQEYATIRVVGAKNVCSVSNVAIRFTAPEPYALFQRIAAKVFDDPNCLCFLLSEQEYGRNQAHTVKITPSIALALLNFDNFDPNSVVDFADGAITQPVATIESEYPAESRTLQHYISHYYTVAKSCGVQEEKNYAICAMSAAARQTYLFVLRWFSLASEEQLARLWRILHGHSSLIPSQIRDLPAIDANKVRRSCWFTDFISREQCSPLGDLVARAYCRRQALSNGPIVPPSSNKNRITVNFRLPDQEGRYQMAPQFAACTSTLHVSLCHETFESFKDSLDISLTDDRMSFTLSV